MNDNKLIAEFMGLPTEVFKSGKLNYYFREFNSGSWYEEHELSYNVSWDWLMPVVENCLERLEYHDTSAVEIKRHLLVCNMKGVYQAVVEFINEHNKYICGSCGDHANEVVFNEDTDVDECTNCIQ